ncbi:type II toxin-antitoxin system RelE family toxin [Porticoccus sp. GXU_MW_L64]
MSYSLEFLPSALKEWRKLGATIKGQFKNKLEERLVHPHVDADKLRGYQNCYKIKLSSAGYRLVYQVDDGKVTVTVVAVGKRERAAIYRKLAERL